MSTVRQEHGQNLAELAMIVPVLLIMLAGVMDFGRALVAYIAITNAGREAARYASLYPDRTDQIIDRGLDTAEIGGLQRDQVSITPTIGASGEPAIVEITTQFEPVFLSIIWNQPIALRYRAQTIVN